MPVYLHKDDLFLYDAVVQQGAMLGFKARQQPPVDVFYDMTPIHFGDYEVRLHHTPGHCPGGVCLQIGKKGAAGKDLFVGDTLFAGSIGRTDLPGGDYATLMRSITEGPVSARRRLRSCIRDMGRTRRSGARGRPIRLSSNICARPRDSQSRARLLRG